MFRYLALGDSYTIGEGVESAQNFPHQLSAELSSTYQLTTDDIKIIATTGWTTDELMNGIQTQEPLGIYDYTTLLIGVNNQYRNYDINIYAKEFASLLYKAIMHTKGGAAHVFVLSIPDWGVTPFAKERDQKAIAKEIAAYNTLKKTITLINKCNFIDITASTIINGKDPSYLTEDLLHYNHLEYKNWVKKLAPIVAAKLK